MRDELECISFTYTKKGEKGCAEWFMYVYYLELVKIFQIQFAIPLSPQKHG